ncbi:hypothetical protein V9T40_013358 [Parthenolecanium corni]|uniref:Rab-GAP TBC domain-containing protein n=1 Tax=Parthenolecanium corni TaxID=536013 RepID=A0AAN9TYS8_9HEMI
MSLPSSEHSDEDDDRSVVSTVADRNGFLGGSQYSPDPQPNLPRTLILKREQKWINMIRDWSQYMNTNYKKVRERCRKGIPPSLRPKAWELLCTEKQNRKHFNRNYFDDLCAQEGNPKWIEDIKKDLHRQFPYHEIFIKEGGFGQTDLFNVLKAYSIKNPTVGYCQAQAPIAAFLLMYMPAENAFWCLVNICDEYLKGYYSQGMETLQIDGDMLFAFVKKFAPNIYKHLKKQKIEPILYMTEWFLCVFTRTLPWPALLRVWDMFLCEGPSVLFKVGLVLIGLCMGGEAKSASALKKQYPTMYETLEALRNPPAHLLEENFFVKKVLQINLPTKEIDKEHEKQRKKRIAQQNGNNARK